MERDFPSLSVSNVNVISNEDCFLKAVYVIYFYRFNQNRLDNWLVGHVAGSQRFMCVNVG